MTGQTRHRIHKVPRAFAGDTGAPYARVLDVDHAWSRTRAVLAGLGAVGAHAIVVAVALWSEHAPPAPPAPRPLPTITAARVQPPPPPARPAAPHPSPVRRTSWRAPQPAQASKVVSVAPTPSGPVDMTDFAMPEGKGDAYVGGYTSSTGTATAPVEQLHAPLPPPPPPSAADKARVARPRSTDWSTCKWPDDAASSQTQEPTVTLRVFVSRSGEPERVDIEKSPGPAFSDALHHCALHERYWPALDDDGRAVAGSTPSLVIAPPPK